MSQVYFLKGHKDTMAVFDYLFRKLPYNAGYAIFAGLEDLINTLEILTFDKKDLVFLDKQGFNQEFISYLRDFRFNGDIYSINEGDIVFPGQPYKRSR